MIAWDHWHIEPSSICALRCPRCPRAEVPETLLNRQLTLDFFQRQLGAHIIQQIKKITFCGNDGDPIYCRDLIDICGWIKSINPDLNLVIITNGSYRTADWWRELAQVLDANDELVWSIDGWDHDSNSQYRINSDWHSIRFGQTTFMEHNVDTYRIWATIAFRFNQHELANIQQLATHSGMDLWQLTKSTKFGSHYPDTYGTDDPLCPDSSDLVSTTHRFQRNLYPLTGRPRPSDRIKAVFWQRAQDLVADGSYPGLCKVGNKGVFLDSQGRFYPCCWTANRYDHNRDWHDRAQTLFNLHDRPFADVIADDFWQHEFAKFDSYECQSKCTNEQLKNYDHATAW